jgi:hypothetical protein
MHNHYKSKLALEIAGYWNVQSDHISDMAESLASDGRKPSEMPRKLFLCTSMSGQRESTRYHISTH